MPYSTTKTSQKVQQNTPYDIAETHEMMNIGLIFIKRLTVNLRGVGAPVEEDTGGLSSTVEHFVLVDLHVVAPLGSDDAWIQIVNNPWKQARIFAGETQC